MKLYRVCTDTEGKIILNEKDFSKLGSNYRGMYKNTFKYEYNKKYLHFFNYYGNIYFMNLRKGYYICEYEVPDEIIPEPTNGYYMDFVTFCEDRDIPEYVIESNKIKFEYLSNMYRIKNYIDYEDYLYGDLPSMIEEVYTKEKELTYEKKLH